MKKRIIGFVFFTCMGMHFFAQSNKKVQSADTAKCLEIAVSFDGTIKELEGNYTAKLIKNNQVIETQIVSINQSVRFVMRKNLLYAIKLEKEGFISKTISISTTMPSKIELEGLYKFKLQTNLISQDLYNHFDDDDVDFPIALVSYGKRCDCFEYNQEYTAKLISRMYNRLLFGG